jgi:hypothetical protein
VAILTPDELREHIETTLDDVALERLADAAEEAIVGEIGDPGPVNELITPRGTTDLIKLGRRAATVSAVTERTTELDEDDYELRSSGYILRRLNTGSSPASCWRGRVDITYTVSDLAERARVQIELVKLDLAYSPGVVGETIGSWSEQLAQGDRTYQAERAAILASLHRTPTGIW